MPGKRGGAKKAAEKRGDVDSENSGSEVEESNGSGWTKPDYADEEWFKRESRKCQHCKRTFDSPALASDCVTSHRRLRCYFCFGTVGSTEELFSHFTSKHNDGKKGNSLVCPFCDATVPYKSVSCHVISLHMANSRSSAATQKPKNSSTPKGTPKKKKDSDSEIESEDEESEPEEESESEPEEESESEEASLSESDSESKKKNYSKRNLKRYAKQESDESDASDHSDDDSDKGSPKKPAKKGKNVQKENKKRKSKGSTKSDSEESDDSDDSDYKTKSKTKKPTAAAQNTKYPKAKANPESDTEELDISDESDSDGKVSRNKKKHQAKIGKHNSGPLSARKPAKTAAKSRKARS